MISYMTVKNVSEIKHGLIYEVYAIPECDLQCLVKCEGDG